MRKPFKIETMGGTCTLAEIYFERLLFCLNTVYRNNLNSRARGKLKNSQISDVTEMFLMG